MSFIPNDFHTRYTAVVAQRNRTEAAALLGIVKAAQASGNASGFGPEIEMLSAISEGRPLGKGAEASLAPLKKALAAPLAPDVAARVQTVTAMAKAAQTPAEICQAKEAVDRLAADIRTHAVLKAIQSMPQTMGSFSS